MDGACNTCGGRIGAYRVLVGRPDGKRDHLVDLGIDETIILKWNVRNRIGRHGLD
jgi:hypothetical protein